MSEPRPRKAPKPKFSAVSAIGALGGLALIVGFFSPLYDVGTGTSDDPVVEATQELERALQAVREGRDGGDPQLQVFAPIIEPATAHAAAFLVSPSPKNLALLAGDARELVQVLALIEGESEDFKVEEIRSVLRVFILAILSMPVIGAYHAVRAVVTKCRRHGSISLALSFFAGLFYFAVGAACIFGVPEHVREHLGSACWLLTAGGALLLFTGIFGVSRETWWKAYLLDVVGLAGLVYGLVKLADERL